MTDQAAFTAYLTGIGLGQPSIDMFTKQTEIKDVESFYQIRTTEFDEVWSDLIKAAQALRLDPINEDQRPVFSVPCKHHLKALRLHLEYCKAAGLEVHLADFKKDFLDDWREHMKTMSDYKEVDKDTFTSVPQLSVLKKDWLDWKELLETRLRQERNVTLGVPLSYLIREHSRVTQRRIDARYPSFDDRLIATVEHKDAMFKNDNRWLYQFLKGKLIGGDAYSYIADFNRTADGRKAFLALQAQVEGPMAVRLRVNEAYQTMLNAHYDGKTRNYTFAKYCKRHIDAHTVLDDPDSGETLSEDKKVEDFLNGIKDPRLALALSVIRSARATGSGPYDEFHTVQTYLTAELDRVARADPKQKEAFRIAQTTTDAAAAAAAATAAALATKPGASPDKPGKKKRKRKKKKKKDQENDGKRQKADNDKGKKQEVKAVTTDQVAKIVEQALQKFSQSIKASVGAIRTAPVETPAEAAEDVEAIANASASAQFGNTGRYLNGQELHTTPLPPPPTNLKPPPPPPPLPQPEAPPTPASPSVPAAAAATKDPETEPIPRKKKEKKRVSVVPVPTDVHTISSVSTLQSVQRDLFTGGGLSNFNKDGEDYQEYEGDLDSLVPMDIDEAKSVGLNPHNFEIVEQEGTKVCLVPKRLVPQPKSQKEWVKALSEKIGETVSLTVLSESYKGELVHELKDPIEFLQMLGIRRRLLIEECNELKIEKQYEVSIGWRSASPQTKAQWKRNRQEWKFNDGLFKSYNLQAAEGDPEAAVKHLIIQLAMELVPIDELRNHYDAALVKVKESLRRAEAEEEPLSEPEPNQSDIEAVEIDEAGQPVEYEPNSEDEM